MPGDKLRFRFAKTGTLRLLSHHDLMRCAERMLRRASLPFKSTAGFHPGPRVVFALSLPLGVEGLDEVVEVEFTREVDEVETLAALRAQAPAGLTFTGASVVPMKATARPRRVAYEIEVPAEREPVVAERCAKLFAADKVWVERLRPSPKRLNIRPYLRKIEVSGGVVPNRGNVGAPPHPVRSASPNEPPSPRGERDKTAALFALSPRGEGAAQRSWAAGEGESHNHETDSPSIARLELDLWVTQTGTARADELLKLLSVADLLDAGVVLRRTLVELRDEVTSLDPADVPPDGPADSLPLDPAAVAALTEKDEEQPAAAGWGASPAGPVVE